MPSDKEIAKKLMLKPGSRLLLVGSPPGYPASLGQLPEGVTVSTRAEGKADVVQVFVRSREELEGSLAKMKATLSPGGMIWVTYPKGTSKIKSDVNRDSIREFAKTLGLEAVAIFSVDGDWSALRLKVG